MPNAPLHPTTDLVAIAWISSITGLSAAGVATTVPENNSSWGESGFVQVMSVGGPGDIYIPVRRPVVQVDTWAIKPNTAQPLWNVANLVADQIYMATLDHPAVNRLLTLPGSYPKARVLSAYATSEPRRRTGDPGGYAHYTFDVQLHWVEVAS